MFRLRLPRVLSAIVIVPLVVAVLVVSAGNAATFNWNVPGPDDWNVDTNWDPVGLPGVEDYAYINNAGSAYIDSTVGDVGMFRLGVGAGESGELEIRSGGTIAAASATAYTIVGQDGTGVLNIQEGGTLTTQTIMMVGRRGSGEGTVIQNGGSVTLENDYLVLAYESTDCHGRYEMHGGTLTASDSGTTSKGTIVVGRVGEGTFIQTDGIVTANRTSQYYAFQLGAKADGTGTYEMSGGELNIPNGGAAMPVRGFGTFIQSGGDVSIGQDLGLATVSGEGTYEISGGTLDVSGSVGIGVAGTGTFKYVGDSATVDIAVDYTCGAGNSTMFELDGLGRTLIDAAANVDLSGSTIDIGAAGGASIAQGTVFTLFQAGSSLTATGASYVFDPSVWDVEVYEGAGGSITAEYVIPEPSTLVLVLSAAVLLFLPLLRRTR